MAGEFKREQKSLVATIAWAFEATRRKNGALRRPEFVAGALTECGANVSEEDVKVIHTHLLNLIKNPLNQNKIFLPGEIIEVLLRSAKNIRLNERVSAPRNEIQKKMVAIRERMSAAKAGEQKTAPPREGRIANLVAAFLNNPSISKDYISTIWEGLSHVRDGTKPKKSIDNEVVDYISRNGLTERIVKGMVGRQTRHGAERGEIGKKFRERNMRAGNVAKERRWQLGIPSKPAPVAESLSEFSNPLVSGEKWKPPKPKAPKKQNPFNPRRKPNGRKPI